MTTKENDKEGSEKPHVNLDKLLVQEIGQFGKFQLGMFVQCLLCIFFTAWNNNEFVFTAGRIATRCMIPECENVSSGVWSPAWISHAVPSSDGVVDSCRRFGTSSLSEGHDPSCPSTLFNTSVLEPCEQYVYENTMTIVYDFNLGCDEWRRAMVGSVRNFGMMVGLTITGYVSDGWGRRRAMTINCVSAAVMGLTRYWAPNYPIYMTLQFLESVLGSSGFTCAYVLMVELLGPRYRVLGGAILNSNGSLGSVLLGLIAWKTSNWKHLVLAVHIPQLITITYFWTLTESVRWLMSKGRFEESERILKRAARMNGKTISQNSLQALRMHADAEKTKASGGKTTLMLLVLKDKRMLTRCLVSCVWWMSAVFVYYGLSINAVNLTGDKYLNFGVVSAVEIPGFLAVTLLVDRLGRKPITIFSFWLCAVCQIGLVFIPNDATTLSLIAYMAGKWAISMAATTLIMYSLELFPTECRHRLYGFTTMVGRLGSILAPLTPALGSLLFPELPFILFGGMAFLAGLLTFLVPETLGLQLPDTMEDAVNMELK